MNLFISDLNDSKLQKEGILSILERYKAIPIKFEVKGKYEILKDSEMDWKLKLKTIDPVMKDYDELEDPLEWAEIWDLSNWGILFAHNSDEHIGGAIIAWNTDEVDMLGGRDDRAVLWDIRVKENSRRTGIGSELFKFAEKWAKERNCKELIIETQNNNVEAMKFYMKMGAEIYQVNEGVYYDLPDEDQVLFRKLL